MPVLHRPPRPRTRLGSPIISVNHSQRYLRQRLVAQQERRAQQYRRWRRRIWVAGICIAFYFLIGRDLFGITRAAGQAASSSARKDVHNLAVALKRGVEAKPQDRLPPSP